MHSLIHKYIKQRENGIYYYRRRVPSRVIDIVGKEVEFISLKTRDPGVAKTKAARLNDNLENFWDGLMLNGPNPSEEKYQRAVSVAKSYGFTYLSMDSLLEAGVDEIIRRTKALQGQEPLKIKPKVEALLGVVDEPEIHLNQCFEKYVAFSEPELAKKSPEQRQRWEKPRETAYANFISIVGDKPGHLLERADTLKFKNHLVKRHVNGAISAHTVNRYIQRVKVVLSTVEKNLQLGWPVKECFADLHLDEDGKRRKAFDPDYVQTVLLDRPRFEGLNEEAWLVIAIMASTGMRPSEICGLEREDIVLDAAIPHVKIRPKNDLQLKTKQSAREIPLAGSALWAFRQLPNGLTRYKRKADSLSACVNKFLTENGLKPSPEHALSSLRHTFQDLLRRHKTDERLQCVLMGHKYNLRAEYGEPSMEEKLEVMARVAFDYEPHR